MKEQLAARGKKLSYVIVDLSPVTDIDASAVHFLMVSFCLQLQQRLLMCTPSPRHVHRLQVFSARHSPGLMTHTGWWS